MVPTLSRGPGWRRDWRFMSKSDSISGVNHTEIRRQMLERRRALSSETVAHASALVVERVRGLSAYTDASLVASYMGHDGEIDPAALLLDEHSEVALPVTRSNVDLRFVIPNGPLEPGPFGIRQPTTGRTVQPAELDLVLLPLVAVDLFGNRLGHGAGHYDRTFDFRLRHSQPVLVGLAHRFQVLEYIQPSAWDVPVDLIITETGILGPGIAPSAPPMGED